MNISRVLFVLALCGCTSISCAAQNPTPASDTLPFTLKPLGHGVYAAIDLGGKAGANAGFVVGDDGVLVIDTFEHEPAAKALLAEIHKLTPLPIRFVVNTHYHLDHVTGNALFKQAGAVVVAQRNVGAWIHSENLKFFGKNIQPEQQSAVESFAAPDVLYNHALELRLGARRIEVRFYPGHTGGDSVVLVPDANVTFCGDLFWRRTLPNLIDATTSKWTTTLSTLLTERPQDTFVPGHGDIGSAADVSAFRGYIADLRAWVAPAVKEGKTGDNLIAAVMPELTGRYSQWNFFQYFAKRNILDTAAEIRGDKKIPQPPKD